MEPIPLMMLKCVLCICVLLLVIVWSCWKELIVVTCIYLTICYLFARKDTSIRIVLLGKTGTGKSSTGNTIFGIDDIFEEGDTLGSITQTSTSAKRTRFGREILVIDTPGLFDTRISLAEIGIELLSSISQAEPGPHVFILVLKIGVFSDEDYQTVKYCQEIIGDAFFKHCIILFTHRDEFPEQNVALQNFNVLRGWNHWIAFDNTNRMLDEQVKQLIRMIDNISHYGENYVPCEYYQQKIRILEDIQREGIFDFNAKRENFVRLVHEVNKPSEKIKHVLQTIGVGFAATVVLFVRRWI